MKTDKPQPDSNFSAAITIVEEEAHLMLERMNRPGQRTAMQKAFDTPPDELGRIAKAAASQQR